MTAHQAGLMLPVVAAVWWNPLDWLKGAGGLLQGAYDQASSVKNTLGAVLTIFSAFFRLFTDTAGFFTDAVKWLADRLFPPELQTWFLGTIGYPGSSGGRWDPTSIYESLYRVAQAPALLLAATASALRVLRGALDHRLPASHAFADALPRFLVCVALIGLPGTTVSLGFTLIAWAVDASVAVASGLFTTFLHASDLQAPGQADGWFGELVQVIGNHGHGLVVVAIGFIPLLIMFLYAAFLLVLRTIMIGFCVATAPLCIATAAFDPRNRFLQFWIDLFSGAALTPIVMALAISISFTLALSITGALVVGPILAVLVLCGGVWMSGKLVHHLTWRHFTHGGAVAGFAAGASTMLGPVQRLGSAGFVAEALGANRDGRNRGIEWMKRLGVAAQGLHPGAPTGPTLLSFGGGRALRARTDEGDDILAAGGAPRVALSLRDAGQAALAGSEDAFNRQAFSAFARDHKPLIGALTRDRPYGSLAFGDRAKLAWERVSPRSQANFADEFLSHWLAGDAGTGEDATRAPDAVGVA